MEAKTMKALTRIVLAASLALALVPLGLAAAQDDEPGPCAGDAVAGTVVAVDAETGLVTIDTGDDGLCTVQMAAGDYSHPIVALLGQYFDEVNADTLSEALETTQVWVVCNAAGACELADEDDAGAVPAQVVSVTENEDGSFTIEFLVEDEEDPLALETEDEDLAGELGEALETLAVEWELGEGEDGPVVLDAGDKVAELHEDGLGFGVIVKLFAMAAESQEACADDGADDDAGDAAAAEGDDEDEPCGVTVDELAEAFQGGTGMGQLFQEYGRPAMLGVGHVRQALRSDDTPDDDDDTPGGPGNGNACRNSAGRNPHCPDPSATAEPAATDAPTTENVARPGNGNGNGANNGNGGNGNGGGNRPGNGNGGGNGGNGNGNGGGNGGGNGNGGNGNGGGNGGGNGNGGGKP
jgi:hypothetical protein